MERILRGRPRSTISLDQMVDAIRRHHQVAGAARELNCSASLMRKRLKAAQLTLVKVLEAPHAESTNDG